MSKRRELLLRGQPGRVIQLPGMSTIVDKRQAGVDKYSKWPSVQGDQEGRAELRGLHVAGVCLLFCA